MPCKLRIQYPGAIYTLLRQGYGGASVMSRGDQPEDVFRDDAEREKLMATLGVAGGETQWQAHAYCLMRKRFHLVVETPEPNLVWQEEFRQALLAAASQGIGPTHYGAQRRETEIPKAERIVKAGLERVGCKEEGLGWLPKAQPLRVQLARQLRQESTLSLKWIASRLHMGSWTYLSNRLAEPVKTSTSRQNALPLFP